jgi:hypothetical protein
MRRNLSNGDIHTGGMSGYPLDQLYKEVAFIAYYFHWDHDQVMQMPHSQRKQWCEEISTINRKLSEETKG